MKNTLRQQMRKTIVTGAAEQSRRVMERVEQLPPFLKARVVAAYWPLEGEVDTRAFIERWAGRKRIVLPVVDGNALIFREYNGRMVPGALGVREPCEREEVAGDRIDLVLVPGLAFTRDGGRLGRGKGYYDRFLATSRACKVGLCFAEQLVERMPLETHDVRMDRVVAGE